MVSTTSQLLLLHGFTGCPESWDAVVERLPGGFDVHRPALLGHGPESADTAASFQAEVDRLARWLGERARPPLLVAGYSMGGRVALGLLLRHRRLFGTAVLISAHAGLADEDERRRRARSDEALARRLEERGLEEFVDDWQSLPLFESQRRLPAAVLEAQRARRLRHRPAGLARALRVLGPAHMPDDWPHLANLDLPIRLLAGARDDKFAAIARAMAERLPHGSAEIVPDAGHNLILEAPAAVADAIARALPDASSLAGSAPRKTRT